MLVSMKYESEVIDSAPSRDYILQGEPSLTLCIKTCEYKFCQLLHNSLLPWPWLRVSHFPGDVWLRVSHLTRIWLRVIWFYACLYFLSRKVTQSIFALDRTTSCWELSTQTCEYPFHSNYFVILYFHDLWLRVGHGLMTSDFVSVVFWVIFDFK